MMELHVKSLDFDHVNVHFGLKGPPNRLDSKLIDHWFNLS
jgi:hypothetical protein